jgi:hydroxyacylglutathione hydrolase
MSGLDVRAFTVGPVQENCYIVRSDPSAAHAVIVDPGEEPERLLAAASALGVDIAAILVTHCHFDHIGAVAPVARATGAPVYCPEFERPLLADIMSWVPPGFGPFESYDPDHTLVGGERLSIAGLDIEVLFTPGHSPGHVTYAIARSSPPGEERATAAPQPDPSEQGTNGASEQALLSGDVLFAGSVGRVDLPGGDWATLEASIGGLLQRFAPQTTVYPGHMGITTLGRERDTNPFLAELRSATDRRPAGAAVAPEETASAS